MAEFLPNFSKNTPGEIIRFCLKQNQNTQEELAQILNLSLKHINEIVKDKRPISHELLYDLSSALGLNEQDRDEFAKTNTAYRLNQLEKNSEIENKALLYSLMPIGEMIKKGWLKNQTSVKDFIKEINRLFGLEIKGIDEISNKFQSMSKPSFRNVNMEDKTPTQFNRIVWYLYAKQKAAEIKNMPVYNEKKLAILLYVISDYTLKNNIAGFLRDLNAAGVKFFYLSHLSKTYTEGAAFGTEKDPVIVLTGRFDRTDNFWFNMAHEIMHILSKHHLNEPMIDEKDTLSKNVTDPNEIHANHGAFGALKGEAILNYFSSTNNYISETDVKKFSNSHNIHPSIIAGILAWHEMVNYSVVQRFKETVKDKIPKKYFFG